MKTTLQLANVPLEEPKQTLAQSSNFPCSSFSASDIFFRIVLYEGTKSKPTRLVDALKRTFHPRARFLLARVAFASRVLTRKFIAPLALHDFVVNVQKTLTGAVVTGISTR